MRKVLLLAIFLLIGTSSYAQTWVNDTKTLFDKNQAVVLTINVRTFAAVDNNRNGIIEPSKGEVKGNFVNAISRLDEISSLGINTLHLLPINTVGVKRAYGTAGSLFAVKNITEIDPMLKSSDSISGTNLEVKNFVDACHKRNIRVIVEMPAYGAYDLYIKKSRWFLKNNNRTSVLLPNQRDIRVFNAGTNSNLNKEVYDIYEKYIDMLLSLNVDGVVVQDPFLKPTKFWQNLISHANERNQQFVFIAEMKQSTKRLPAKGVPFVSLKKLLNVGFDAYLGDFNKFQSVKTGKDFNKNLTKSLKYSTKKENAKAVLADFAMYNDVAPILVEDIYLSKMIIWLSSTLPVNSIYTDGFQTGDDYSFDLANMKAPKSYTDDKFFFANRGKMDIYNFSRRPKGSYPELLSELKAGNKFKAYMANYMPYAELEILKTEYPDVFAYALTDKINKMTVFVLGSFDLENIKNVQIEIPKMTKKTVIENVHSYAIPQASRGKFNTLLAPADIQVFLVKDFALK